MFPTAVLINGVVHRQPRRLLVCVPPGNNDSLSNSSTTKQPNISTFYVGCKQVDYEVPRSTQKLLQDKQRSSEHYCHKGYVRRRQKVWIFCIIQKNQQKFALERVADLFRSYIFLRAENIYKK